MVRVLLVEDDKEIARIIKYYLVREDRYEVVWVQSAAEACSLEKEWFDVLLLDIMLPDMNGVELCAKLREWYRCPIIFISCLDDASTIVRALEQGGDDYVVKPFDNRVLEMRIQANLRRVAMEHAEPAPRRLECPDFYLDPPKNAVVKAEKTIFLSAMEFRILFYLMRNPNKCYESGELYKVLWGKSSYGDNRTVVVHIHNIRKKIEEDPADPKYIKNVWGKGYMFEMHTEIQDKEC